VCQQGGYFHLTVTTEASGRNYGVYIRALHESNTILSTDGPGKLCCAFDVDLSLNEMPVDGDLLFIEETPVVNSVSIIVTPRIGVGRGKELPYRYTIQE